MFVIIDARALCVWKPSIFRAYGYDWMQTGQLIWNQFYWSANISQRTKLRASSFTIRNIIWWRAVNATTLTRAHYVSTRKYHFLRNQRGEKLLRLIACLHTKMHENSKIDHARRMLSTYQTWSNYHTPHSLANTHPHTRTHFTRWRKNSNTAFFHALSLRYSRKQRSW